MKNRYTYELKIERRENFRELVNAAFDGDVAAQCTTTAIFAWLARFTGGNADCFACGEQLRRTPGGIVVMLPLPQGDSGIASGLCDLCLERPGPVLMRDLMATIKRVMPSAQLQVVPARKAGRERDATGSRPAARGPRAIRRLAF